MLENLPHLSMVKCVALLLALIYSPEKCFFEFLEHVGHCLDVSFLSKQKSKSFAELRHAEADIP